MRELQLRLKRWSCDLFCLLLDVVDGEYDARVTEAVAKFQTAKQVDGDPAGVYGPNTRRALEAVTSIE
ncbi:peptidoglycan-binding protein [Streptomyces sp. M41]|uniref:peptidoglycan-binding domain-containing protein n=1 Tax=Streptomyces sp. M41 TaxID=3059412 RepID=UPI00374CB791